MPHTSVEHNLHFMSKHKLTVWIVACQAVCTVSALINLIQKITLWSRYPCVLILRLKKLICGWVTLKKKTHSWCLGETRLKLRSVSFQSPRFLVAHLGDSCLILRCFRYTKSIKNNIMWSINLPFSIRNKASQIKGWFPRSLMIFSSLSDRVN